jgi:hypothetical protein
VASSPSSVTDFFPRPAGRDGFPRFELEDRFLVVFSAKSFRFVLTLDDNSDISSRTHRRRSGRDPSSSESPDKMVKVGELARVLAHAKKP